MGGSLVPTLYIRTYFCAIIPHMTFDPPEVKGHTWNYWAEGGNKGIWEAQSRLSLDTTYIYTVVATAYTIHIRIHIHTCTYIRSCYNCLH